MRLSYPWLLLAPEHLFQDVRRSGAWIRSDVGFFSGYLPEESVDGFADNIRSQIGIHFLCGERKSVVGRRDIAVVLRRTRFVEGRLDRWRERFDEPLRRLLLEILRRRVLVPSDNAECIRERH